MTVAAKIIPSEEPEIIDLTNKYIPTPKQILGHIAPEMYILIGGAMRGGKSVFLVNEGLQLSLDTPNNRGAIFRWENKAFKTTTYLTMMEYIPETIISRHHKSEQYLELINDSVIYYGGLKPQPGIGTPFDRIKSMELGWVALDEASEIPEDFFKILISRLTLDRPGIRYKMLLASNPEPGWVKVRFIDNQYPNHKFIPALPGDNPHNPPGYEQRLRDMFDEDWISRYVEGSWDIKTEGNLTFPYSWVRAAMQRSNEPSDICDAMSFDIADEGGDETVTAARWGTVARIIAAEKYLKTTENIGRLKLNVDNLKPRKLRMDAVGMGIVPFQMMKDDGYDPLAFVAGASATQKERYVDMHAEACWHFRKLLEEGVPDIPDDDVLSAQLCSVRHEIKGDKKVMIVSKKKTKGRDSPDRKDAIVMVYYEGGGYRKKGRVYVG